MKNLVNMSCTLFLKVNISYMHARALPPPPHTHRW